MSLNKNTYALEHRNVNKNSEIVGKFRISTILPFIYLTNLLKSSRFRLSNGSGRSKSFPSIPSHSHGKDRQVD